MGANDYILIVDIASAVLAFGCAVIPGTRPLGRFLCVAAGLGLIGLPASGYLVAGIPQLSPAVLVVPALLLVYAVVTLRRHLLRGTCYPDGALTEPPPPAPVARDRRRRSDRRVLPGEYGHVPVDNVPPPHDPWAALYGSFEREVLRGNAGRHREAAGNTAPPADYARQAAFAAMQAYAGRRITAWDTQVGQPTWFLPSAQQPDDPERI